MIITQSNNEHSLYSKMELHYETIEDIVSLDECDGLIKEVLDIYCETKILKQYIFKAPIVNDNYLNDGYRVKLILVSKTSIEFTGENSLGQTKITTNDKIFNVTINLPKNYEEGKTLNIEPSIVDISSRLINKQTLYISTYIKFTLAL